MRVGLAGLGLLLGVGTAACEGKKPADAGQGPGQGAKAEADGEASAAEREADAALQALVTEIRLGELLVEGPRDGGQMLEVISNAMPSIAACYREARGRDPSIAGALGIRFLVAADGSVPDAILDRFTITDRPMQRCLRDAFKAMKFPAGVGETKATMPMDFGAAPPPAAG